MRNPTKLNRPFLDTSKDIDQSHLNVGDKATMEDALAQAEIHRSFDCPFYKNCLDHAARNWWPSFSCQKCEHHNPEL